MGEKFYCLSHIIQFPFYIIIYNSTHYAEFEKLYFVLFENKTIFIA